MRSRHDVTSIWTKLFPQFSGSGTTLQGRVKEMMVHGILTGLVPANARVPPSRALANALRTLWTISVATCAMLGSSEIGSILRRPSSAPARLAMFLA